MSGATSKRRVKVVREKPTEQLLLKFDSVSLELDRLRDANVQLRILLDLLMRRIDGLEAKIQADRIRESVKW